MERLVCKESELFFTCNGELIRISACGTNAIRFQSFPEGKVDDENYTLMPQSVSAEICEGWDFATLTCGTLTVRLNWDGKVTYLSGDKVLLEEKEGYTFGGRYRSFTNQGSGLWSVKATFRPWEDEHFFGLGHSWDNEFDLKGSSIDICHMNAKCTIPYVYSSRGYGFIWNNPAPGLCELSNNRTRWSCQCCKFMDYVVIAGTPKEACTTLADLTGYAPKMPDWATGLWQSRLRYETQEELLSVIAYGIGCLYE